MSIKVLLAFSNYLFSEGVACLLEKEDDIKVDIIKNGVSPETAMKKVEPDIILLDFITLFNAFTDVKPTNDTSFILVDTHCGDENIVSAFISRKVAGILMEDTDADHLVKSIRAVKSGEIWVDNKTVKNLLSGLSSLNKSHAAVQQLSNREKEVVALVADGYRNKEIGMKLCISEPTVKTHLYRVFQKLGIHNRPQLIVYAIKNRIMQDASSFL